MTAATSTVILADHPILYAIPAFAPAIVVVGVVVFIAMRDRRQGDDDEETHSDSSASNGEDV
ncbi:hypothetical protein MARA_43440 [Mycolicibacterium arabiense]|uniref:Uncharacterized protein n=1 Tax=Mycolicibacterium arabiense TaxID=1286181 RepID=A0A7I7S3G0_9MYCO|nr:hypothetical protein [Mycolicibacterium arabiense]MCV7374963.1 hypothetical protein [Mycolicibacterium arabiense]BBY50876.1 hypothetical protein MARA_43440 [Mycolicibacterium arabiense]